MGITITVDLGTSSAKDIARAAKFMLEFAGYQDPSVGQEAHNRAADAADRACGAPPPIVQGLVGARGSLGEEIHEEVADDNGPLPTAAFSQLQQVATPEHDERPAAPTLPPPPPGIEVDAHGVPWDNRIHAGSRAKIADGTWRQKRNLDPEVYKQVMEELRHTMGVERRAPQPPVPPVPQEAFAPVPPVPVEVPPPPFAASAVPPAPPTSSTPPVPVSAGAAPAASPGSPALPTFPELMKKITAGFAAKTITQQDITRAVQKVGLTALPMLAARPDLVGDVATELGVAL